MCWLAFVDLTQTRVSWGEGTSVWELFSLFWPVGKCGGIFFISDWHKKLNPLLVVSLLGRDPGLYKKTDWAILGEQARKEYSFMVLFQSLPPWSFFAFHQWCIVTWKLKPKKKRINSSLHQPILAVILSQPQKANQKEEQDFQSQWVF